MFEYWTQGFYPRKLPKSKYIVETTLILMNHLVILCMLLT